MAAAATVGVELLTGGAIIDVLDSPNSSLITSKITSGTDGARSSHLITCRHMSSNSESLSESIIVSRSDDGFCGGGGGAGGF